VEAAASVAYPEAGWTWDDFLNTALAVTDPAAGVYGYWPLCYDQDRNDYERAVDALILVNQRGGKVVDDWQNPSESKVYEQAP
jgi:multiple sugar transport system substrate-binding protein